MSSSEYFSSQKERCGLDALLYQLQIGVNKEEPAASTEIKLPEPSTNKILSDVLQRIASWTETKPDAQVWSDSLEEHTMAECRSLHWSQETKVHIRNLERVIDALQDLQASATRLKVGMAKGMKSRYLHEGISKLPDDVLLAIFTYLVCNNIELFRIAGVCRRFRDTVFSHGPFWDYITTSHRPEAVDIALLRSKQTPLTALVSNFGSIPNKTATFLRKIQAHAHRITSLLVFLPEDYDNSIPAWREINDVLRLLSKPGFHALEEFSLLAPRPYVEGHGIPIFGDDPEEEDNEGHVLPAMAISTDDDLLHVYLHWRLSSLKRLTLYELVPRVQPELALTSLHLQYNRKWHLPERPLTQLMRFFKTQSRLQDLTLIISLEEEDFAWKETILMPELCTLYLGTPDWGSYDRRHRPSICPIPHIFQHLLIPSAKKIELKFTVRADGPPLETIFVQDYPRLTAFALTLTCEDESGLEFAPFRLLLSRSPLLTHLALDLAHSIIQNDVPDPLAHPPPPLKELVLTRIANIDMDGLKKVVECMGNSERGNSLEYLLVYSCPELTGTKDQIDILKQLLPNCAIAMY